MALEIRRTPAPSGSPRPLRVVPAPTTAVDPIGEEFLFGTKQGVVRGPVKPRRVNGRLVALLVLLVAVVGGALVFRNLSSQPDDAQPTAQVAGTAVQNPAPPPPPPAGDPMSIVDANITTDAAAHTYRASVTVRNPTDVAVNQVAVDITIADASGATVRTEHRVLDALASGRAETIVVDGEFDPQGATPAGVTAVAKAVASSA